MRQVSVSLSAILKKAGIDGFLLALVCMILLAYIFPFAGSKDSPVPLSEIAGYGVSFIFFFYGLRLSPEKLKAGLSNWKLHGVVHLSTFVFWPFLIIVLHSLFPSLQSETVWLGIFYVAALPSTVSSSVVMVSIARGNISAAIFNSSISSLLGVFVTPIWMDFWLSNKSSGPSDGLSGIIFKLLLQVVLPVGIGLLLNKKFGHIAEKQSERLKKFDQLIILTIVYTAFCESFYENVFAAMEIKDIFILLMEMSILFMIMATVITFVRKILGFNREDQITSIFCGSKKSLVHGTVMAKVLFAGSNSIGILLLPLMIYHALQLMYASLMATRFATNHPS